MKEMIFDVMLNGRFVKTLKMRYCPLFILKYEEISEFVEREIPSMRGKDYRIEF